MKFYDEPLSLFYKFYDVYQPFNFNKKVSYLGQWYFSQLQRTLLRLSQAHPRISYLFYSWPTHIGESVEKFCPGNRGSIPGWVRPKTQKWYLISPCITLSSIKYLSIVKWRKEERSNYWKWSLRVALDYGRKLYFIYIYIFVFLVSWFNGISTVVGYLMLKPSS